MSDIPISDDCLREILRRVPVESLFRLRSVCKRWRGIIDDPVFVKLHTGKGADLVLVKPKSGGKIYYFPLKEMVSKYVPSVKCLSATNAKYPFGRGVPHFGAHPVPSCNDWVLISSCNKKIFWRIWNPFTEESIELGKCDGFSNDTCGNYGVPYSGIGHDKTTDDHKVVRIVDFHTYIYSVSSKMWRRIDDFPFHGFNIVAKKGIYAYGALHWVAYSEGENGHMELGSIAALDLSTEKYRKVLVPSEITELRRYSCPRVVALNDCLFIYVLRLSGHFVLWMIKGYGCDDTWVKMISLSLEDTFDWIPIAYLKSKERILLQRHCYIHTCCWYDLVKKRTERNFLVVIPETNNLATYRRTYLPFVCQVLTASLATLMGNNGAGEDVASEGTSKKKRKRTVANKRLAVKIIFNSVNDDVGP